MRRRRRSRSPRRPRRTPTGQRDSCVGTPGLVEGGGAARYPSTIEDTSPSTSSTRPASTVSRGSRVANCDSRSDGGMKWPGRAACRGRSRRGVRAGARGRRPGRLAQQVAVGPLERRAGDHPAAARVPGQPAARSASSQGPRSSSVERPAGGHLGDVRGGVQVVAVGEGDPEPLGEGGADGRLPDPDTPITTTTRGPADRMVGGEVTVIAGSSRVAVVTRWRIEQMISRS